MWFESPRKFEDLTEVFESKYTPEFEFFDGLFVWKVVKKLFDGVFVVIINDDDDYFSLIAVYFCFVKTFVLGM